jgi:hypothetical protein
MNNSEKYKHAFDTINPSKEITADDILRMKEEKKMRKGNFGIRRSLVSIAAAVVLIIGVTGGAYAADLGGFRNTVDTWLYGEPVQAEIEEVSPGNFIVHYPNGVDRAMGGVSYDSKGNPIPATMEDIKGQLDYPEIMASEDGTINLYYRNEIVDITDDVKDGRAEVKIKGGLIPTYVTINWTSEDNYSIGMSHTGFQD